MSNPYAPPAAPVEGGKKRGSMKGIIWTLVVLLALAGVFAAVAIPAHYDRVYRSRVAAAVWSTRPAQDAITEHFREHKRMPERLVELPPELKLGSGGMLTWTFPDDAGDIGRATIVFRPRPDGDTLLWDCRGGTLVRNHRVASCR
jgi:hypothetical protein